MTLDRKLKQKTQTRSVVKVVEHHTLRLIDEDLKFLLDLPENARIVVQVNGGKVLLVGEDAPLLITWTTEVDRDKTL